RRVARDLVDEVAAVGPEVHLDLDERRRGGAPEQLVAVVVDARVGEGDAAMQLASDDLVRVVREELALDAQLQRESLPLAALAAQPQLQAELPPLEVRCP